MPVAVIFLLALIFRTVDMAVCSWLSTGTHFLWHITGAAAGFSVVRFVAMIEVADWEDPGIVQSGATTMW